MRRVWLLAALILSGCGGPQQSAFDPAGTQSERIAGLGIFFAVFLAVVFVLVIGTMLLALGRRHRGIEQEPLESTHLPSMETERRMGRIVSGATIVTILILITLLIKSVVTGQTIADLGSQPNPMVIEVTGNQWWWDVRYVNQDPNLVIVTANEIHIPVGRPIRIQGTSHDVIHSFWVPDLHGKRDLIPSHTTSEWIEADKPGRYRGQCAEFCGMQHAHMAMWVVAESQADFDRWARRQLEPSVAPSDAQRQHGQQVFLSNGCVLCHAIRGTPASGHVGPDLTHLASRFTIAAGTLPNTRGGLGGWIVDPQTIKPGNHMATINIPSQDLEPLIDYLESLQ